MKALAIIVNIFFPGIGTLIVKKWGQGVAQIILGIIAVVLALTGIGGIIGVPLAIGVWIWAIVSAATSNPESVQVIIQHQNVDTTANSGDTSQS